MSNKLRSRSRGIIISVCVITLVVTGLAWHWLSSIDQISEHEYGAKAIASVNGRTVYLKREVGLRFDRLSLSLNGDRCFGPNEATDYVFRTLGAGDYPFSYVQSQSGLIIYSYLEPPQKEQWTINVEQREYLANGAGAYRAAGASEAQIGIAELRSCR